MGHDELILIAELGAAFAGFLAIFLIFARKEGRFSPADSLSVRSTIAASFLAVFVALVPLVLATFGLREQVVWQTSSAIGLLLIIATAIDIGLAQWRLSPDERAELNFVHACVAWCLGALITVLFLANVLALWGDPSAGPHLAGLVCVLAIATVNFITIAAQRLL